MINKSILIETLTGKLRDLLAGDAVQPARQELEAAIKSVLASAFHKMDLMTRDEFAVQMAVLQRTREMVEQLEERLQALESRCAQPSDACAQKSADPQTKTGKQKKDRAKKSSSEESAADAIDSN